MLLKCCTQYVSKFGNSAMATGLGNVSFHCNTKEGQCQRVFKLSYICTPFTCYYRKAMLKILQARLQQYIFENFKIYKLCLKEAEEPEIKLLTFLEDSSRKTSTSASLTTLRPLAVWITKNWKVLKEMGIPVHLTYLLRNLYVGQVATVRTRHGTINWFKIGKGLQ